MTWLTKLELDADEVFATEKFQENHINSSQKYFEILFSKNNDKYSLIL